MIKKFLKWMFPQKSSPKHKPVVLSEYQQKMLLAQQQKNAQVTCFADCDSEGQYCADVKAGLYDELPSGCMGADCGYIETPNQQRRPPIEYVIIPKYRLYRLYLDSRLSSEFESKMITLLQEFGVDLTHIEKLKKPKYKDQDRYDHA